VSWKTASVSKEAIGWGWRMGTAASHRHQVTWTGSGERVEKRAARRHDSVAVRGRGGLIGAWVLELRGIVALCLFAGLCRLRGFVASASRRLPLVVSNGRANHAALGRRGQGRAGQSVADVSISRTAVSRHGESLVDEARIVEDGRDVL